MFPTTLEAGSFWAGWHLSCPSPGSSTVHPGSIHVYRDDCVVVAAGGVGGIVLGALASLWVLAGLVSPIPSRVWIVGRSRVRACQPLLEHLRYVIVIFHNLNKLCDVFFKHIWHRGAFDFPGHSDWEA